MIASQPLQTTERAVREAMRPPARLTVSEWADRHRRLSPEASAEPGPWRTDRAPYQRGIMDAISDPGCESVVVMSSAQVGKTEILNNAVGWLIDHEPCPILVLQPTLEMAEAWSKDRLAPMLRDTRSLRGKVRDPTSRSSGNTLRHKEFPGGHITMAGANSPASLASRPIRVVACDEVDRYPISAGTEGDPIALARKRTSNFWNRKLLLTSTPTIKGISRIEAAFEDSTQEHYHVPCPECGAHQRLRWAQVKWDDGQPGTARYECEHCDADWDEGARLDALADGEWRAEHPDRVCRGFHLSELYSPWSTLPAIVAAFLEAKRLPETLKTWVNTALGETWEEAGETIDPESLYQRREVFPAELPESVLLITAGADQQRDRIECEIVAWTADLESWSVGYHVMHGDMTDPGAGAWAALDDVLCQQWPHASGHALSIAAAGIDTHGDYTDEAYRFCKPRWARHVFAVRGKGGQGAPVVAAASRNNRHRVRLFTLGVDTLKSRLYSRLFEIGSPGPGYCHFPADRDPSWFDQLASEKATAKWVRGRRAIVWTPKPGTRQEALDCRVYAMGALEILNPAWAILERKIERRARAEPEPKPPMTEAIARKRRTTRRRRMNFVSRY